MDSDNSVDSDWELNNYKRFNMGPALKTIAESMILTSDSVPELEERPFYVEDNLTSNDFSVDVEKIGKLNFPINQAKVEELLSISSKAKFGLREQTLLDKSVRDTQVIAENLKVNFKPHALDRVLNKMRENLGFDEHCKLVPHLHNLLIYSAGQFFSKHQDTEKLQNMVATMVIVLPSAHLGGNLVIEHGSSKHVFISENIASTSSKCIAFFCDCIHEIEKVKEGFRCVLTYNLCLESDHCVGPTTVNEQLEKSIIEYFAEGSEPKKLVYMLNHMYSEHGLKWNLLKGEDRTNVSAILAVAEQLNLIPHLTLVQIKKSWFTEWEESNVFNGEKITLSYWISKNGSVLSYKEYNVLDSEICWTKNTESFKAYKVSEGYTGNEGATLEKWYSRAAVIVWHDSKQTQILFEINYENELKQLNEMISEPGCEQKVIDIVEKAGENLYPICNQNIASVVNSLIDTALYIKNAEIAKIILTYFKWNVLNSDTAHHFARLDVQYGKNWLIEIFNTWKNIEKNTDEIFKFNNTFVKNFIKYEGDAQVMEFVLNLQLDAIIHRDEHIYNPPKKQKISSWERYPAVLKRIELLQQLFETCAEIKSTSVLEKIINYAVSNKELYPENNLAELLVKICKDCAPDYFTHFETLKNYLIKAIEKQLSLGQRSENDWSISAEIECSCYLCIDLQNFLHSDQEKSKKWPLNGTELVHVQRQLTVLCLPAIDISVLRSGSHIWKDNLQLVKNYKLFAGPSKKVDTLKSYLKLLR